MNDRITSFLSRSGPALAVIGLHVLIIYGLIVSMGIVEVSKFAAPIQAVFIDEPMSQPEEEIEPVKPEIEEVAPVDTPAPELEIAEIEAPLTDVEPIPSENAIAATPMTGAPAGGAAQQLKTTNRVEPAYPATSRRLGEEGTVRLRVLVDESGRPRDVNVLNSSGFERLDRAAIDAVKRWRFEPATDGRNAITAWTQVAITFKLQNGQ